ncbi:hypothetical protein [Agromyces sp. NPDC058104]|uniref:hypothetical protein n=1 Tax=Agromyces sp. NPDC058104 TaxID=3346342 RepID=UPI0036DAE644
MTDVQGADAGTSMQHEFTASATTADRVAAGYTRYVNTRPWLVVSGAAFVSVVLIVSAINGTWLGGLLILVFAAGSSWIGVIIQQARMAQQLRAVAGEGHRLELHADAEGVWVDLGVSEGRIDYRAFDSAVVSGRAVLLKTRHGRTYTILPIELFPPATLAYVQEAIAASR